MALHTYSREERLADGVVQVVGVALCLIGTTVLLTSAVFTGQARIILAAVAYGGGLLATFGLSAAYSLARTPALKEAIRPFDHAAIYVMIAGTYTPFALVGIGGETGYGLLAVVWTVAVGGVLLKLLWPRRFEHASVVLYVALGWTGLLVMGPLLARLTELALVLLVLGGGLYTTGVLFHLWNRLRYQNAVWHSFVLAAACCHYWAVLEVLWEAS